MLKGLLLLLLTALSLTLSGCTTATWQRQSDLEWQKASPNYQPIHPDQHGHEWGW